MTEQAHRLTGTDPCQRRLSGIAYVPRWLGGMLCYICFGLGGLLSSLTILPLLKYWPGERDVRIKRVQKAVHLMFRGFVRMLSAAGVIRLSTKDIDKLSRAEAMLVIANHPTLIDVVVLISLMPNAGCIVKQGLWRNPFLRGVVSAAGYIPNRGAELLLEDCREVLGRGTNLIIFPEGTRTVLGEQINPFARGAANIALRTGSDVLPVLLHTKPPGLTKQDPWWEIPRRTIGMTVEIGMPLKVLDYQDGDGGEARMARKLTRDMENYYKQRLEVEL